MCPRYSFPFQRMLMFQQYKRISELHDRSTKLLAHGAKGVSTISRSPPRSISVLPDLERLVVSKSQDWKPSVLGKRWEVKASSVPLSTSHFFRGKSHTARSTCRSANDSAATDFCYAKYHRFGRKLQFMVGQDIDLHGITSLMNGKPSNLSSKQLRF